MFVTIGCTAGWKEIRIGNHCARKSADPFEFVAGGLQFPVDILKEFFVRESRSYFQDLLGYEG
jgi:hypothetical protein